MFTWHLMCSSWSTEMQNLKHNWLHGFVRNLVSTNKAITSVSCEIWLELTEVVENSESFEFLN